MRDLISQLTVKPRPAVNDLSRAPRYLPLGRRDDSDRHRVACVACVDGWMHGAAALSRRCLGFDCDG